MADQLELFKRCPLFAGLSWPEISALLDSHWEQQTVAKGQLVRGYRSKLVIVLSGRLEVHSMDGTPLNLLLPGQMFGVANLFTGRAEPPTTVIAQRPSELMLIAEPMLQKLLVQNETVMRNYLRFLTDRIWFLNWKIQLFSADTAEQKLMLYLRHQPVEEDALIRMPPLSRLAELLGMGRASLYRAIESLESSGKLKRISGRCWKLLMDSEAQ